MPAAARWGWGLVPALAVALLSPGTPARADDTSVTIAAATQSDDDLIVSGTATFSDQPFVTLGTDPPGDVSVSRGQSLGADLTGASAAMKRSGHVQLRWGVAELPPVVGWMPTGIIHGWTFCVQDSSCWDLFAQPMDGEAPLASEGYGELWRCVDPGCDEVSLVRDVPVAFDAGAKTATAVLELSWIHASPGSILEPVIQEGWEGGVWTGYGSCMSLGGGSYRSCSWSNSGDGIPEIEDYRVPVEEVALAVAATGQDPASVAYVVTVAPGPDGAFTAAVGLDGLAPGEYAVYARACYGGNNCGYASVPVTIV